MQVTQKIPDKNTRKNDVSKVVSRYRQCENEAISEREPYLSKLCRFVHNLRSHTHKICVLQGTPVVAAKVVVVTTSVVGCTIEVVTVRTRRLQDASQLATLCSNSFFHANGHNYCYLHGKKLLLHKILHDYHRFFFLSQGLKFKTTTNGAFSCG